MPKKWNNVVKTWAYLRKGSLTGLNLNDFIAFYYWYDIYSKNYYLVKNFGEK